MTDKRTTSAQVPVGDLIKPDMSSEGFAVAKVVERLGDLIIAFFDTLFFLPLAGLRVLNHSIRLLYKVAEWQGQVLLAIGEAVVALIAIGIVFTIEFLLPAALMFLFAFLFMYAGVILVR